MGSTDKYELSAPKQKMWQAMRILRTFTPSDIAQTSEVSIEYASAFVSVLRRAGYLKRDQAARGAYALHQLIRNTGPNAPRHWTKERQVFDLNRGATYALD